MDSSLENSQHILEEDYDENYEPTEEEILEYCKVLKLDPVAEKDLLFIAKEGIKAPLPKEWKPIEDGDQNIYYFNFVTGDSTWEHPCDEFYRKLLQQEREKRKANSVSKGKASSASKKQANGVGKPKGPGLVNGGGVAMRQPGGGGVGMINQPLGTGLVSASLPGRLAPLSLPGKAPPSLSGVKGLPMLKKAPPSLGPLPTPSQSSSLNSGSGKPLSSVGANGSHPGSLLGKMGGGNLLGMVDLDSSVKISNQYEEEGSSEFDSEQDSSESVHGQFESKIGETLLGAKDLGLEEEEDIDEEEEEDIVSSDEDDASVELQNYLKIEKSGGSEVSEDSIMERPAIVPGDVSMPGPAMDMYGLTSPNMSLPLAPLASRPLPPGPQGGFRSARPSHSRGRERGEVDDDEKGGPISLLTPVSSPAGPKGPLPTAKPHIGHSPAQASARTDDRKMSDRKTDDTKMNDRKMDERKTDDRKIEAVTASLEADHQDSVDRVKQQHARDLEALRSQLDSELQEVESTLTRERASKEAELRKRFASEQAAEEANLKAKKLAALDALKAQVEAEKEDEEAVLMEGKEDALRILKQKIAQTLDKESKELHASKNESLAKLKEQLANEREAEEAKIRQESQTLLAQLRTRLEAELEAERQGMDQAHRKEMEAMREGKEEELRKEREVVEARHREAIAALRKEVESEHEDEVRKIRAEAEKGFDLETVKAQVEKSFKQAELEMNTTLGAELEGKRSEMMSQHEQELNVLKEQLEARIKESRDELEHKVEAERVKLESEFDAAKLSHTQEHQTKIRELQDQYQHTKSQIEKEKAEQSKALESMELEFKDSKEKLASLQADVEKQLGDMQERRRSLEDQEAELKSEEERLEQLRAASAKETEDLLKKQQSDLKNAIEKEKKTLKSLKESRIAVESEVQQLGERKMTLELCVEQLSQKELEHRHSLAQQQATTATSAAPTGPRDSRQLYPPHPPTGRGVNVSGHLREEHDGETSEGAGAGVKVEESEEEGEGETDTAMDILDLEPPASKTRGKGKVQAEPEPSLETMRARLLKHQRELSHLLADEQRTLGKTKAYLKQQERNLKERRATLQQTHREWSQGIKSHGGRKHQSHDGNLTLMKDIQSKLNQEAAALTELEERMRSSSHLLALKEQAVNKLQASIGPEVDPLEGAEVPAAATEPTYTEQYLSKLDAILDRHRHSNGGEVPLEARERRVTSPLPYSAAHRPVSKSRHTRMSSEGSLSSSSSSSSLTSSGDELEQRGRSQSHFVSSARVRDTQTLAAPLSKEHGHHSDALQNGKPHHDQQSSGQTAVMKSLHSINTQLGQLLSRVGSQGEVAALSNGSMHRPAGIEGGGSKATNISSGTLQTPIFVEPPLGMSSSSRWADPVFGPTTGPHQESPTVQTTTELDSQKRRHTYSGQHPAVATPMAPASVTSRLSTKELVRSQTDWLKEFRLSVPQLSQLRSHSIGLPPPPHSLAAPPPHSLAAPPPSSLPHRSFSHDAGSGSVGHSLMDQTQPKPASRRPRLVLDSNDNIKLVHV